MEFAFDCSKRVARYLLRRNEECLLGKKFEQNDSPSWNSNNSDKEESDPQCNSDEGIRKINLSCVDSKNFRKLCQMMHLRVANLVKFKLDETRQVKFRSLQLKMTADLVKKSRCISPPQQKREILDIKNNESKFPMLSPKRNLRINKIQSEIENYNNRPKINRNIEFLRMVEVKN